MAVSRSPVVWNTLCWVGVTPGPCRPARPQARAASPLKRHRALVHQCVQCELLVPFAGRQHRRDRFAAAHGAQTHLSGEPGLAAPERLADALDRALTPLWRPTVVPRRADGRAPP